MTALMALAASCMPRPDYIRLHFHQAAPLLQQTLWLHVQLQKQREQSRDEMLGNIYGSALPARMQIERQILRKCAPDLRWHERAAACSRVLVSRCLATSCP